MSNRSFGNDRTESNTFYPRQFGMRGAITAEHYLAAQAGMEVMRSGGNAVDGAIAATLVEGVVNPQMHTIGGECPMLICMAGGNQVVSVNGNTAAPERATPEAYRSRGLNDLPDEGILVAGVPAAFGALITALMKYGTLPFGDVAAQAIYLARNGFPVHRGLLRQPRYGLHALEKKLPERYPGSAALYLPGGHAPAEGDLLRNLALANVFDDLVQRERRTFGTRQRKLRAVLDGFYHGDVALEIDRFSREHDGLLALRDLERFETHVEAPARIDFHGTTVFKCGFWNQGPVLLQSLAILERFDLQGLGHNSPDYWHLLIEAMKLAFADREQYYGDPLQVKIPAEGLLSKTYAIKRAALIDPKRANPELRPGDPWSGEPLLPPEQRFTPFPWGPGTVHVDAIDEKGNFCAFTPSGGWIRSNEVIPNLGFPLGNRLQTFYLDPPDHPNRVAPFRRPRTTISPSLAFRGGKPWLVFGSMGGDMQDQWQLQFFLNRAVFGMTLQEAIEAPKLSSEAFPAFFHPKEPLPNRVRIEPRVPQALRNELARRGHDLELAGDWTEGYLLAAERLDSGMIEAGADPRGFKSDVFPACALTW
jgi:gamma-glutamyltranspeptidase/glutathione hydrolase